MNTVTGKYVLSTFLCGTICVATITLFYLFVLQNGLGIALGAAVGVPLSFILFYLAAGHLSRTISNLISLSDEVIKGNLDLRPDEGAAGELKQLSLNMISMCKGLTAYFSRALNNVQTLEGAGIQISANAEQISQGTQNQAEQIQALLQKMEEFSSAARQSVEEAAEVTSIAKSTDQTAREGAEALKKVVLGMDLIDRRISELRSSSDRISQIIEVIDDIAAQTNLLALNAAIEAARAGAHGRGFAVVADEVRHLAERSGAATKEIHHLVTSIQSGTDGVVEDVQNGIAMTDSAGKTFHSIEEAVAETLQAIQELTESARNQAQTSERLVGNAQSIAAVTEEAAATTQETAATALGIPEMAKKIKAVCKIFKIG
ncbi:MAG: methyl-accepting chemotaxis protein [Firmicutes bacterium]|nr:methyl-accepting chemotaxis protein [Bacillota bacterium]